MTFASPEQAQACIEQFDGVEMNGRRLNINKAEERGRKRREPATEFKRGGPRGRPGGPGGGGGRRDERSRGPGGGRPPGRPPRGAAAAAPPPEPEYTTEDRRDPDAEPVDGAPVETDEWGKSAQPWKKKKKKSKGSRRGLRSKKRNL